VDIFGGISILGDFSRTAVHMDYTQYENSVDFHHSSDLTDGLMHSPSQPQRTELRQRNMLDDYQMFNNAASVHLT